MNKNIIEKTNREIIRLYNQDKNQHHQFHVTLKSPDTYFDYYRRLGFRVENRKCPRGFWDISIYWNLENIQTKLFVEEIMNENHN